MNLKDKAFLQAMGDRVRDRRTELKLTQQQLGEKCGLHRTFIGSVERGERTLSILHLRELTGALRIPLGELLAGL